jgi:hypothetical protein
MNDAKGIGSVGDETEIERFAFPPTTFVCLRFEIC